MAIYNKSLNETAYDFIELTRANYKDTDSLDIRQVKNWIDNTRATLVKQRLDRNPFSIDGSWLQKLTVAGSITDGPIDFQSDFTYFVSDYRIPTPINRRGGEGTITLVDTGVLFADPIEFVNYEEARDYNNGKFNSTTKYAFLKDDYFYVKNEPFNATNTNTYYVTGVFQNPRLVATFNNVTNFDSMYSYPIDQSIVDQMKQIIRDNNLSLMLQQIEDKILDGRDSTTKQG